LTLETAVDKAKLRSILHYSGLPISSTCIVEGVAAELGAAKRLANVS
jgi:2-oxoglutarate ferredoxin oxidoreductase subunit alpha